MSHSEHMPRTTGDMQAELQANDAAANRKWNQWTQPGFEGNMAQLAIEATMDKEAAFEPLLSPKHSMIEVVPDHTKQVEKIDGIRDKRTTNPQKVAVEIETERAGKLEAAKKKEEALRQPLKPAEIASATVALGAGMILQARKEGKGNPAEGDMRALSRLNQMAQGDVLEVYGENHKDASLPLSERLHKIIERMEPNRLVDGETGEVIFGNYAPSNYYVARRAEAILDVLSADPKASREGLLDTGSSISEVMVDAAIKPMIVEDAKSLPAEQLLQNVDRNEFLPTFPWDRGWVREVRAREARQLASAKR